MNKPELIQLIQHPDLPSAKHTSALRQVLNDFPYFTNAQVLLSQALKNEGHYEYEKYLKQTALAVPDREVLYYYLHQLAPHWETVAAPAQLHEPIDIQHTNNVIQHEPILPEQEPEIIINTEPEIAPNEPAATAIESEVVHSSDMIIQATSPVIFPDPEAHLSADELEAEDTINSLLENPLSAIAPTTEIQEEEQYTEQETENAGVDEEHSFMEWLQLASGKHHTPPKRDNKPEAEISTPEAIIPPVTQTPPALTTEQVPEKPALPPVSEVTKAEIAEAVNKSNVNDFHNILDKFIRENPSISRPKAEFFNPVNMAKQSVEEDEELVTETLANLYYKQGNHRKAIRAYEKLCLLYPSKMTYFASLIQKIKTEIKD